ncbi:MAG: ABC transporter substrate-binding protein [Myxococcales bacterium]|nr:ABC transporter substrate-binding protein [Myxococcales bacterium]
MTARLVPLLLILITGVPALAAPTADAGKARTTALIAAFKAVERAPAGKALTPAQRAANEGHFKALDALFDRDALLKGALGPNAKALDPAQRARFDADFWWLLRSIAYPDSGAFFERAEHAITRTAVTGAQVDVTVFATLADEDIETEITLHWAGEPLRLVDASFDGASLAKDYQNQFGRILAKKGAAGLLAVLAERRAKIEAAQK